MGYRYSLQDRYMFIDVLVLRESHERQTVRYHGFKISLWRELFGCLIYAANRTTPPVPATETR